MALASSSQSRPENRVVSASVNRHAKIRRFVVWAFAALLLVGVAVFSWLGYQANTALSKISDTPGKTTLTGLLPFLSNQDAPLKGERDDRINVALLGIGGSNHPGGQLSDTIMVISLLPKEGKLGILSIPRDLYVPIPGHGSGKINSAHALGEQAKRGDGPLLTKETLTGILGVPIHYYLRIDFQGFEQLINALGGVDVNVEKAIADPLFPDENLEGYDPFYLKAGPAHMNGSLALKFARSRETTSDFDRAHRQQQVVAAIKQKLLSPEILTNPARLTQLLTIAGNHIRTDLPITDLQHLLTLSKKIDLDGTVNKVLSTAADGPLTSRTDERAGYIIVPRAGNFSEVQELALTYLGSGTKPVTPATIRIQNATGVASIGGNVALLLRSYGYQVGEITTTIERKKSQLLAKKVGGYPDVTRFLTDRFHVEPEASTKVTKDTDIILVIGADYLKLQGAS